jgi:peptidylprolyl isomerase
MQTPQAEDIVTVHYTVKLKDGSIVESSKDKEPLSFMVGNVNVMPSLNQAVLDMSPGDVATLEISPEEGAGPYNPDLRFEIEREALPDGAQTGMFVQATIEDQTMKAEIVEISEDSAVLDANPPYAGQNLIFEIELISINEE